MKLGLSITFLDYMLFRDYEVTTISANHEKELGEKQFAIKQVANRRAPSQGTL